MHPHGWLSCALVISAITCLRITAIAHWPWDLYADEAQYWLWGQSLEWGYFSKPPMVGWVAHGAQLLWGDNHAAIKLPSALAYAIAALGVYGATRQLATHASAWWAALLFASLPGVHLSAHIYSTDPLLLMWGALFVWAFFASLASSAWPAWVLTGITAGALMLTKYNAALLLPACLYAYHKRHHWQHLTHTAKPWLAITIATIIWLPNLLWNQGNAWVSLTHTADNAALSRWQFSPSDGLDFIAAQWGIAGLFALPWFIKTLRHLSHKDCTLLHMVFWCMAPIALLAFGSHAHGNWAALAFVPLCIWLGLHSYQQNWATAMLTGNVITCLIISLSIATASTWQPLAPAPIARAIERISSHRELPSHVPSQHTLLTNHRRTAAYLHYYRPNAPTLYVGTTTPENHYHQHSSLTRTHKGQHFTYISPIALPPALAAEFSYVLNEKIITITLPTGHTRDYHTATLLHYSPSP